MVPISPIDASPAVGVWNPAAVKAFWNALLDVRKGGILGPISLSYAEQSADDAIWAVKIYHDAPYSLGLRTFLDVWSFSLSGPRPVVSNESVPSSQEKMRILRAARLLLVDATSESVLYL